MLVRRRPRSLSDARAEASSRFEIGRVLGRSSEIVRARWLELVLVTFLLGWATPHLIWLAAHSNYRSWSQHLTPLGLNATARLGMRLTYLFALAMVMAIALRGREAPALSSISQVLRALPVLFPAWLVSQTDAAWDLWVSWSGFLRSLPIGDVVDIRLTALGLEVLLVLTATVALGVFYPVVLEERQAVIGGVSRAWRLMHGARWRFAALYLIYVATEFVISLPGALLLARAGAAVSGPVTWITEGLSDVAHALWCVVVVASYIELRAVKEGPPHAQTAQAFA